MKPWFFLICAWNIIYPLAPFCGVFLCDIDEGGSAFAWVASGAPRVSLQLKKSAHQFAWKRVISLCGRHTPRSSPNRKEAGTLISLPVQPTSYASLPATTSRIYILFYPSRCGARAALTAYRGQSSPSPPRTHAYGRQWRARHQTSAFYWQNLMFMTSD